MNTNQPTPNHINGTFTFQCVLRFKIDPETAANLLVESDPTQTVHNWLRSQSPAPDDIPYCGNTTELRIMLGKYLADKKVDQARLLLPCTDQKLVPF